MANGVPQGYEEVEPLQQDLGPRKSRVPEGYERVPLSPDPQRQMNVPISELVDKAERGDTGPGPHPYARRATEEDVWQPTEADILQAHGVSPEGAPSYVRSLASYTRQGSFTPQTLSTALQGYYGTDVETRKRDGALEFKNPETGRWTIYNAPSLEFGDVASLEGELYPTVGSVIGATGGGIVGSAGGPVGTSAGAFTGDFVGSLVGEYQRLRRGKQLGLIGKDVSEEELLSDAAVTAAVGSGMALGTAGLAKLVTNYVSQTGLDISADALRERIADKMQRHQEFGSQPTTGQLMRGTSEGEDLLREQEKLLREPTPYGDKVRGKQFENVQATGRALDVTLGPGTPAQNLPDIEKYIRDQGARGVEVGEDIQEAARQSRAMREQPQMDRLEQLRRQATEAVEDLTDQTTPGTEVGGELRGALQQALDEFRREADRRYGEVRELMGTSGQVTPESVIKLARDRKRLTKSDVYASLAPEDKRLLNETLKLAGRKGESPRQVTFEQANRAVQQLRRLERESRRGIKPAPELKLVRDLKEQWQDVRRQIASTVEGGVEKLEAADAFYRMNIERLYNSVVGELLDTKPGSYQYDVPDEKVFDKIFRRRDPSKAREVLQIVDRPDFARAKQRIGEAVKNEWRERVVRDDGTVDPKAHARFVRDYGEQMQLFLSPQERRAMRNSEQFKRQLDEQQQRIKELESQSKKALDVKIDDLEDPVQVVQTTWTPRAPSRALKLHDLLSNDPAGERLIPAYRSVIKRKLFDQAMTERQGVRQISSKNLRNVTDRMGPALDRWFGEGTSNRLNRLADAVEDLEAQPMVQARPKSFANVGTDIARSGLGQFTLQGRMLTGMMRVLGRRGQDMMSRMLLDPNYLAKLQERKRRLRGTPTAVGIGVSDMSLPSLTETELNPRRPELGR